MDHVVIIGLLYQSSPIIPLIINKLDNGERIAMINNNSIQQASTVQLKKTLKLRHVIVIGLAYLTPMTVFDSFIIVSEKSKGHVPSAYILALLAILFTAISYGKLVQRFPEAGSAYTYAQKAINSHVGFLVGWLSLLDYLFLPMINVLLVKIYLSALFPDVASWLWVILTVATVTVCNLRSVTWVANLNMFLVFIQIMILITFIYLAYRGITQGEGLGTVLSLRPFFSMQAEIIPIITGATVLCFSFLGFDAVTTLSEETTNARIVIPKAIFLIALYGGIIFVITSYFIQIYFPDLSRINNPDNALPDIALAVGGHIFMVILSCCAAIGALASGLASQASVARLLYVMGRDHVFSEKIFGYIHPTWHTPAVNILVVGSLSLLAILFDLESAMALINFGALVAFTFVNIAVISYFFIKEKRNQSTKDILNYLLQPLIGMALISILWLHLANTSLILGVLWGTIGFIYLAYLTKGFRRPPPRMEHIQQIVTSE